MEPEMGDTVACPACGAVLPAAADRCSRCGRDRSGHVAANPGEPQVPASRRSVLDHRWFVLTLLFCVAAIFGLPFLWKSRAFSTAWKLILSVVVTLYTVALLWLCWIVVQWSLSRIMESLG